MTQAYRANRSAVRCQRADVVGSAADPLLSTAFLLAELIWRHPKVCLPTATRLASPLWPKRVRSP